MIFLITCLAAAGLPAVSQDPPAKSAVPWGTALKKGQETAKKEGKLLLLHFRAEGCKWCEKMDVDTFRDGKVGALCAKDFVSVALDVEREKELAQDFGVERVPAALVILPEGDVVDVLDGYVAAQDFVKWLETWRSAFDRLREAQASAAKKPDNREAACHWAEALLRLNQPERASKVIEAALALFPEGASLGPDERKAKAELLVHLGDAFLELLESPKRLLEIAGRIEGTDPGGKLGFEVHAFFLRAAADDMLSHELEEESEELEREGKKALAGKRKADARKLRAGVLARLEEGLAKYPDCPRTDAMLVWTGHLLLEARKDEAQARKLFQRVIDRYPESDFADEARQRLGDLGGTKPTTDLKDRKP